MSGDSRAPSDKVEIGSAVFSASTPFGLIAGPCAMESREHAFETAGKLKEICAKAGIGFVYKSSYDKANRTSLKSERGIGLDAAMEIFADLKRELDISVLTDVHTPDQVFRVAPFVDALQIPAFLCRQTDLLVTAAQSGKIVNVKKGQFLAPWDMKGVLEKIIESGNRNVLLTDRGTCFGYNNLVSDFRSLPLMADLGCPIVFDATHSVQKPGGLGSASGGERRFVSVLARAAVSVGVSGLFIETHQDPDNAPSDGPNMLPLAEMPELLERLAQLDRVAKGL